MSLSLGELAALCIKAGRGAGLPWGLAEELGWAVRWLAKRGLPAADGVVTLLGTDHGESALSTGLALSERSTGPSGVRLQSVRAPLMMVPFLARTVAPGCTLSVQVAETRFLIGANETSLEAPLPALAPVSVSQADEDVPARSHLTRAPTLDPKTRASLEAFARQTYAPPNERSRLLGAGAGLADND
ncbi:MAG: DUF3726 domain-containing protein [Pseudomonadota bacterium]